MTYFLEGVSYMPTNISLHTVTSNYRLLILNGLGVSDFIAPIIGG